MGIETTNQKAKGRVLHEAQDDVPCSVKPFLHTKRIAGIGKQYLVHITGDVLTLLGLLSWLKALTCSD
jgi:hypothetical protein